MMPRAFGVSTVLVAALVLSVAHVSASGDPFGSYCIVKKVVMGQDEGQRPTAQIWGVCAAATGSGYDDAGNYVYAAYGPPQTGYLYYFAAKGKEDTSLKEWTDLKGLAGTGEIVGIGSRLLTPRMRWGDEKPQSPDEYPIQMGLAKVTTNPVYAKMVAALKKMADGKNE